MNTLVKLICKDESQFYEIANFVNESFSSEYVLTNHIDLSIIFIRNKETYIVINLLSKIINDGFYCD